MSLSGRERRILAEIEQALEREDPELAKRVAAINKIESGGEAAPAEAPPPPAADPPSPWAEAVEPGSVARPRRWSPGRRWLVLVVVTVTLLLLILAVATA